jgi:AcrR family transcriptional regulator
MARLTRVQSQAQTRARLVATAKTLFLRDGYALTSLEKVADKAGYSKGAVYSNFRNKDELCLAVLEEITAEQAAMVAEALAGARTIDERLAAFQSWAEANIGNEAWTALEVEFAVGARRNPTVRKELTRRSRTTRELIARLLAAQADELGITLPMPAEAAATALLSLGIGLGVQRAIDPSIPVTVLTDALRLLAANQRIPAH